MVKKRAKTITFPRYTIAKCEEWLTDLSPASQVDRVSLTTIMGYTTPHSMSAGSAVGAMGMYGLIKQNNGNYEMTPLGRSLRMPLSESQQRIVRILTFLNPEKFREMYTRFKGSRIKNPLYLRNLIGQQYGVTDKVARQFERTFLESGLLSGVIRKEEDGRILVINVNPILKSLGMEGGSFDPPSDIYNLTSDISQNEKLLSQLELKDDSARHTDSSLEAPKDPVQETLDSSFDASLKAVRVSRDYSDTPARETIPCHNLVLDKQIETLKVITAMYERDRTPVMLSDVSSVVGVSQKNVRTCLSFWESINLLSENQDGWQPSPPLVSFVTSMDWGVPLDAKETLRVHLLRTWFGSHIHLLFQMRDEYTRESLQETLGKKSGYLPGSGKNTKRLNILLQLLELAGIIAMESESDIVKSSYIEVSKPQIMEWVSETESVEVPDYSSAISNSHDLVQFELGDGIYQVSKNELEKFVRENGKKVSQRRFSLK
ncbi:MAG: hypothetical protein ACFFF9_07680 [Candidatus Thorarchaeota archaeon]